jgi:hypothetical protein
MGADSVVCLGAVIAALILLICAGAAPARRGRRGAFYPSCYSGLTSGMMPSIDEAPPTPCGAAGVGARGAANCCGGFNVPPAVS